MLLRSPIFEVLVPYAGKSKFEFWHNLEKGHNFVVVFDVVDPGRNRGVYTSYLGVHNLDTEEEFKCKLSDMIKYLDQITYREIQFGFNLAD